MPMCRDAGVSMDLRSLYEFASASQFLPCTLAVTDFYAVDGQLQNVVEKRTQIRVHSAAQLSDRLYLFRVNSSIAFLHGQGSVSSMSSQNAKSGPNLQTCLGPG